METPSPLNIKGIIETLLFISEKPVTVEQIKGALGGISARDIRELIQDLQKEHQQRQSGMIITEIAGGYQMLTNPVYAEAIRRFYKTRHKEKLSRPALETLAIVAYKQPVTRADIELIRGVNSDGVTAHLLEKELIKIAGRKDIPGRPYLYGTTKEFLEYFGLKSLEDLPRMEDFSKLQDDMDAESAPEQTQAAAEEQPQDETPGSGEPAPGPDGESGEPVEESAQKE